MDTGADSNEEDEGTISEEKRKSTSQQKEDHSYDMTKKLKELQKWMDKEKSVKKLSVDYMANFNNIVPKMYRTHARAISELEYLRGRDES